MRAKTQKLLGMIVDEEYRQNYNPEREIHPSPLINGTFLAEIKFNFASQEVYKPTGIE